jgi:hypothetical protein
VLIRDSVNRSKCGNTGVDEHAVKLTKSLGDGRKKPA